MTVYGIIVYIHLVAFAQWEPSRQKQRRPMGLWPTFHRRLSGLAAPYLSLSKYQHSPRCMERCLTLPLTWLTCLAWLSFSRSLPVGLHFPSKTCAFCRGSIGGGFSVPILQVSGMDSTRLDGPMMDAAAYKAFFSPGRPFFGPSPNHVV